MRNIVTAEWLIQHQHDPDVIILDASMRYPLPGVKNDMQDGCIEGALHFDFEQQICDKQSPFSCMMPSAEQCQQYMQQLGINQHNKIVVYDNIGMYSAPRAWWMIRAMGHEDVVILNGGLPAWMLAGGAIADDFSVSKGRGNFTVHMQDLFVDAEDIADIVAQGSADILDARSPQRFSGEEADPRPNVRSGHIPGSKNLHYKQVLQDIYLKDPTELVETIAAEVPDPHSPVVLSCGSGITACILALAAVESGYSDIRVYDGSWSEWGQLSHTPVATGV